MHAITTTLWLQLWEQLVYASANAYLHGHVHYFLPAALLASDVYVTVYMSIQIPPGPLSVALCC